MQKLAGHRSEVGVGWVAGLAGGGRGGWGEGGSGESCHRRGDWAQLACCTKPTSRPKQPCHHLPSTPPPPPHPGLRPALVPRRPRAGQRRQRQPALRVAPGLHATRAALLGAPGGGGEERGRCSVAAPAAANPLPRPPGRQSPCNNPCLPASLPVPLAGSSQGHRLVAAPARPAGFGRRHGRPLHPLLEHDDRAAAAVHRHRQPGGWGLGGRRVELWLGVLPPVPHLRHARRPPGLPGNPLTPHPLALLPAPPSSSPAPRQVCNLSWSKNVNELVSTHGYSQNQIIVWRYPGARRAGVASGKGEAKPGKALPPQCRACSLPKLPQTGFLVIHPPLSCCRHAEAGHPHRPHHACALPCGLSRWADNRHGWVLAGRWRRCALMVCVVMQRLPCTLRPPLSPPALTPTCLHRRCRRRDAALLERLPGAQDAGQRQRQRHGIDDAHTHTLSAAPSWRWAAALVRPAQRIHAPSPLPRRALPLCIGQFYTAAPAAARRGGLALGVRRSTRPRACGGSD